MQYYLKRCGFQELGSVGEDGKAKRGRYLMSSQNQEVLDFFPSLSKEIPNDTVVLPLIPLYLGKKTYCSYVYHNSKYTGTKALHPRNEYRIYLNNEVENNCLYLSAGDIVIFRKCEKPSFDTEGNNEVAYFMDVISNHQSADYFTASRIIEQSHIKGAYALFEGTLPFFEEKTEQFEAGEYSIEVSVDDSVTRRIEKSTSASQDNIFNAATFRDFVLAGYNNACAISGQKSVGVFSEGLDVVYIRPKERGGSFRPDNGLALCHEYSLAFVQGKFTLSDDYEIIVHPSLINEELYKLNSKQIRVPAHKMFRPGSDNLQYHRENIYGLFLSELEESQ